MQNDRLTVLTILGMALVTYATRAGGVWVISRITISPRISTWLRQVPGAVLVAIVAPLTLDGGVPSTLAALVTICVAVRTKNLLLSIVAGVVVVYMLRHFR